MASPPKPMSGRRQGSAASRPWAVIAAVFGVLTLAVLAAFQFLPDVRAAGPCYNPQAIIDLEFASTAADLDRVFGPLGNACRVPLSDAMEAVNRLDAAAFIPAYTLFGLFAAIYLAGGRFGPLTLLAMALSLGALAADYVETLVLLNVTPQLSPAPGELLVSSTAAWIKFLALGAQGVAMTAICLSVRPRRPVLAAVQTLPMVGVVAAAIGEIAVLSPAIGIAWVALLLMALRTAVFGR